MSKFIKGDKIIVTAGKDKGKEGVVEKVFTKKGSVLIPEVNMYKKHVKPMQGRDGGIYDLPRPLSVAKVAIICPNCKKATRVGFKIVKSEKMRICKKCGKNIVVEKVKSSKK